MYEVRRLALSGRMRRRIRGRWGVFVSVAPIYLAALRRRSRGSTTTILLIGTTRGDARHITTSR